LIVRNLDVDLGQMIAQVKESDYSKIIFTDWQSKNFFLKQFFSGAFIAIVMTGLDQDMMQKNLSCRNVKDAKKNMITLSWVLVVVNLLFLTLGAILYIFAAQKGIQIPELTDEMFPTIALNYLGPFAGIVFIIGLISAAYSSADSALTSLTTSFSVDILAINKKLVPEQQKIKIRKIVHFLMALLIVFVIIGFQAINNQAVISKLFTIAGYTYGPLLGLFSFGLFTNRKLKDKYVPIIAIISPALCYVISNNSEIWFNGYKFGFELLILNGLLTFLGLLIISLKTHKQK
jgi:Na+/proline symporter